MTMTRDRRTELLGQCRLFAGLTADQLGVIGEAAEEVTYPKGRTIVRQGEIGTGFFVVVSGLARVVRDGVDVARLGPGEFFGELSVLDGGPRIAQVVADDDTTCLAVASWELERILLEQPTLSLAILRELARRLRSVTEAHNH